MHSMYIPHANTVHMSHQGLSGTSVGPRTTFLLRFQDPGAVGVPACLVRRSSFVVDPDWASSFFSSKSPQALEIPTHKAKLAGQAKITLNRSAEDFFFS